MKVNFISCILSLCTLLPRASSQDGISVTYTAADDASWAIYSQNLSTTLGEDKQLLYDDFIQGCQRAVNDKYGDMVNCAEDDKFRLRMNRDQPQSCYNYTEIGYKKIRAPKELFDLITNFYNGNKGNDKTEWATINTYHNMWSAPPTIMHLNQAQFSGGGASLQTQIWNAARDILEEWSGQVLSPVSLYGIRLYHNASILTPHVDRFPLVISAIINVDQDVVDPWPLEVYGHDGTASNVTMEPGDMVLYESHSVVHGRPFPLNGNYFANVFVHFEPVGPLDPSANSTYDVQLDLPPYLIPGSKWESEWKQANPQGWRGSYLDARQAARKGDVGALRRIAVVNKESFMEADQNGWTPLHEAVRVGNKDAINTILYSGHDKDLPTLDGSTPLNIARTYLGETHEVTQHLIALKAVDNNPPQEHAEL